jgi:hypothetical protein
MKINMQTIPHYQQRYETVGDWYTDENGVVQFRVSDMKNDTYEFLVLAHEMVEWFLCKIAGISQVSVDKFDIQFEKDREAGLCSAEEEPGDSPAAPYHIQHCIATGVERMLCGVLGVPWKNYNDTIMSL